jgi:hypothetical protein
MTTILASTQSFTAAQPDMLGSAPSLNYDDFLAKVSKRAMLKGTTLDTLGLLGCVLPSEESLALPREDPLDDPISTFLLFVAFFPSFLPRPFLTVLLTATYCSIDDCE